MSRLEGRQADVGRNEHAVLGGFEDDGREVVKKNFKSGKAADKPSFFMGGCDPTVPTGPKRKLKTSWLAQPEPKEELPPIPKPTRKWTPVGVKKLPSRSKSHDGTMSSVPTRGGKKPVQQEKPITDEAEKGEEKNEVTAEKAVEPSNHEPNQEEVKVCEPPKKEDTAWTPPVVHIRKPVIPSDEDKNEQQELAVAAKEAEATVSVSTRTNGECSSCKEKEELIQEQAADIQRLKQEKGDLAREIKQTKGSQRVNKELKEEVSELKEKLKKADKQDANNKAFHKLENKLNTLKMTMDGRVNKDDIDDLRDHVNLLNMILNQDLKKEGMKNVWA